MPRRARVRQGDRQAAKRAGKNEIAARKGGTAAAAAEKQPFEAQKERGAEKNFSAPPPVYYSDRLPEILHPQLYTI